jgi:hypothetical protein
LKNLLHIMMGNIKDLTAATSHWLELFASHFLYIRPFTVVSLISMHSLALLVLMFCGSFARLCYRCKFSKYSVALLDVQCSCKDVSDAICPITEGFTCSLLFEFPFTIAVRAIPCPQDHFYNRMCALICCMTSGPIV